MASIKQLQDQLTGPGSNSPINPDVALDPVHGTSGNLQDVSVIYFKVIILFVWVLGVIAFIAFIYGGILYMTAGGEAEKAEKGKKVLIGSIIGMIIIMLSYAIYNTFIGVVAGGPSSVNLGL